MSKAKLLNDAVVLFGLMFQAMLIAALQPGANLGIDPVALGWLSVINVGVGVLLNRLQTVGQDPNGSRPTRPTSRDSETDEAAEAAEK